MFYIKVEDKNRLKSIYPNNLHEHVIEEGALRVTALCDNLFSFYSYRHPIILVGEALAPVSELEIRRAYRRLVLHNESRIPGDKILTLAVIDIQSGLVRVFKSISCNRPVLYYGSDGLFVCASHIRLLRGDIPRLELDEDLFPEFLVYRLIMPPRTIYRGISCLPGGWTVTAEPLHGELRSRNLWRLEKGDPEVTLPDAVEDVIALLRRSMSHIKDSKRPATLLLSGGVNSTVLGAFGRDLKIPINSVSSGFHAINSDNKESYYAQSAADYLGFDHKIVDVGENDYLPFLIDAIAVAQEPINHLQSALVLAICANAIRPETGYLINGQNADLLFGADMHFTYWKNRKLARLTDRRAVRSVTRPLLAMLANRNDRAHDLYFYTHANDHTDPDHFLWGLEAYGDFDWIKAYYEVDQERIIAGRMKFFDSYADWPVIDRISMLILHGDIDATIRIWGKFAEHYGHIMTYPFSNQSLIYYGLGLDWKLKAHKPKYIIKKVAARMGISEEIINRPRQSFGFDPKSWGPRGTIFQPLVDMAGEMFDRSALRSLQTEDRPKAMILWSILNLFLLDRIIIRQVSTQDIKDEILRRRKKARKVLV